MPTLALRKPSSAPLAAVDAFVSRSEEPPSRNDERLDVTREGDATEAEAPSFRRASKAVAKRRTKPDRRRATVYFDLDVARALAAHVVASDQEMSSVVNEALRVWLSRK